MSKIVGIGGVFLHFKGDESEVKKWYSNVFEMKMSEYGTSFIEGEQLALMSFKRTTVDAPFINFRVDDIEGAIENVKNNMGKIHTEIEDYPYGKFAQIVDPFGNRIELWEPVVEYYKKMVNEEVDVYK